LRQTRSRQRSIAATWLVSYFTVLLIPMLISSAVYVQSARIVEREINLNNESLLLQMQQELDAQLRMVETLGLQIALNERLIGLANVRPPLMEQHHYAITQIIKDLRLFQLSSGYVDSFYIALNQSGLVLTPGAVLDKPSFYSLYHTGQPLSFDQWEALLTSSHTRDYASLPLPSQRQQSIQTIAYLQSMPMEDPGKAKATILMYLNEARLKASINTLVAQQEGTAFILDERNRVLAASTSFSHTSMRPAYADMPGDKGLMASSIEGREQIVSYLGSAVTPWKYVLVLPKSLYMEKVTQIRRLLWLSLMLCLLVGGLVSSFLVRRQYDPIKRLVGAILKKTGVAGSTQKNEYLVLRQAFEFMMNERTRISRQLDQQTNLLRDHYVMKLLQGTTHHDIALEDAAEAYDLDIGSGPYAVMLIHLEEYENMLPPEPTQAEEDDTLALIRFSLRNVSEEVVCGARHGVITEFNGMLACLASLGQQKGTDTIPREEGDIHNTMSATTPPDNNASVLREYAETIQSFFRTHFRITLTIGLSGLHQTPQEIPMAYQEALQALEYKLIAGNGNIIAYPGLPKDSGYFQFTPESEMRLIHHIQNGNVESAITLGHEILNENHARGLSAEGTKYLIVMLMGALLKATREARADQAATLLTSLPPLEELQRAASIQEMRGILDRFIHHIGHSLPDTTQKEEPGLKARVDAHIGNSFGDPDLSVSSIAKAFNLAPSYLSKLYKDSSGVSLLHAINLARVEEAKSLLVHSSESITDITRQVGYLHSNTLIRIFKRYEGVTPGRYRELHSRS
jgi:AraC-like DNA-binding protein